ncbi:MAG: signal peptidase I [Eubacterium sp.]|nr:signal peptidase I [Eubacterium sp.]
MAKNKAKKDKRRTASVICRLFGFGILILVIGALLPITLPQFMGYEVFNVISGSMEPEIPVGSAAYVKAVDPRDIESDDIIAFMSGGTVITHRVIDNYQINKTLTTKGDANAQEDLGEVPYDNVIGKVVKHVPYLGQLMWVLSSNVGKMLMMILALCGALLNILASRLKGQWKDDQQALKQQQR